MTDTAAAITDIFSRMPGRLDAQAAAGPRRRDSVQPFG